MMTLQDYKMLLKSALRRRLEVNLENKMESKERVFVRNKVSALEMKN